jgi:PknH-like extracellular domain
MAKWCLALLLGFMLTGCTRVIDDARAQRESPAAPISELQVRDLLSPKVQDEDGNLFVSVEPERCSGVAREVDPPFIFDRNPARTDGGHWTVEDQEVYIEEMVGVFPADFDPAEALAEARRTIESCRDVPFTVTTMRDRQYVFTLQPQIDSGSTEIVLWSFKGADWGCDSAFIAAHNAAIEISTCGPVKGYDVLSLARDALKRIDALANMTA